jgi:hypothetical protein
MHLSSHPYVPHVLPISVFLTWSPEWYKQSTKGKGKLSLSAPCRLTGRDEVKLLITSAVDWGKPNAPAAFPAARKAGSHWTGC